MNKCKPALIIGGQYIGVSALRQLNARSLRNLQDTLVVMASNKPLAVIVPYGRYMAMQNELELAMMRLKDGAE